LPFDNQITWVKPTVYSRFVAEITLAAAGQKQDRLLCFHGLPPLLRNDAQLLIFQQNRIYFGQVELNTFAWRTRQRLRFEKGISRIFRHRVTSYWVQTPSMARSLQEWYGNRPADIRVMPFAPPTERIEHNKSLRWDFLYVADGEAHKNHRCLIEAWILLSQHGLNPSLALTLSGRDKVLAAWVEQQASTYNLQVCNLGQLPHADVLALYGQARALIFPSQSESFGLPLIEARDAGLPIIAGELDFVRDVCEPVESFDPHSAVSIARAVRRFLGQPEAPLRPADATDFLMALIREIE
jgi:glycosyltransferase involved in cell wall biosynthesis